MAESKKSFVLYADYIETIEELSDEEAGKLIKHIYRYVNDQNPLCEDKAVKLAFIPIKLQLKRDLVNWEAIKEKRSEAGKASAEAKRLAKEAEQISTKSTSVESVDLNSTKSTVTVNDNVNVINNTNKHSFDWDELIVYFNNVTGKKTKVIPPKVKDAFKLRIKEGFSKDDIANAIFNCYNDPYHKENNHKYLTLEFISRSDKLDRYSTLKQKT